MEIKKIDEWNIEALPEQPSHGASKEILKENAFLATFPRYNPNPVMRLNRELELIYANEAASKLVDIWHEEEHSDLAKMIKSTAEKVITHKKTEVIKLQVQEKVYLFFLYPAKEADYISIYGNDITEMSHLEDELLRLATVDVLTGLPNRHQLDVTLHHEIARAKRSETSLAVLFLDLDDFKKINDTMGHSYGDKLLSQCSRRMKHALREEDFIARFGGDEFVVVLSELSNYHDAGFVAQKLVACLRNPYEIEGRKFHMGVSIGISIFPYSGEDASTLVKNADLAMYRAKKEGGNNYCYFSEELGSKHQYRVCMENELRSAIATNEFYLHYQPQYDLEGNCVAVEVLLRWNSALLGEILPETFIPMAEKIGQIGAIGEWVLNKACEDMSAIGFPCAFSVNVSGIQLGDLSFFDFLDRCIKKYNIPNHYLELELTETSVVRNFDLLESASRKLKALNVKISIDDFGKGESSLGRIAKLPISKLKIDKLFIKDIHSNTTLAILESAYVMAKHLGFKVLQEGVEEKEQLEFLQQFPGVLIQGYYLVKPVSLSELKSIVRSNPKT
ncbi:MAG: putative bifunctional diguanylate cyclase/phosphodiesterase [Gammaproteobacteria bacterium]